MHLDYLRVFIEIAEKGSMAAAGRALDLSRATVSDRVSTLEEFYGVSLLNRTTRSVQLTEAGEELIEGARTLLADADELDSRIRFGADNFSGRIRISAPRDLGRTTVAPAVDAFLAKQPRVSVELLLSDGYLNIVDEGIDFAVRLGALADSTLRMKPLGNFRRLVVASPNYIERYGSPMRPTDLQDHNCVVMKFGRQLDNAWRFRVSEQETRVIVAGDRVTDDGALVRSWALDGHGIALKSELDVGQNVESGELVSLLEDYRPNPVPLQMVFPPGRMQTRRVQALAASVAHGFEKS